MIFSPVIFAVQILSFGCELAALFFLACWGWHLDLALWLRWLAVVATLLLAGAAWGIWAAPNSASRLTDPARLGFELLFYGAVCGALLVQGQNRTAAVFGGVVAAQLVASFALHLRGP
ncbi:hypothetical protein GCM10022631_16430 [Deinococcus rubellus]|uniref:YrdB family protein n=1 Tax=Deinococcus rubellus TaxID=1889240 RepID=A0ABY5YCS3_9DEIO|nr:YrdB family protein [Deinococcus rubellus]UWX62865.1 YrdB family protein [Deinococcus rubellus]